jgi:hypothetical protein
VIQQGYDPIDLLAVYNRVMTANGLSGKPMSKTPNKKTGRSMRDGVASFGEWCVRNNVDPGRFIRARHEAIRFRYRISFEQLASDKFLTKFRQFGDDRQSAVQEQDRLSDQVEDDTPLDSDELRHVWEQVKRANALDRELCMLNYDMTGGWNPRSLWCGDCPIANECKAQLPEHIRRRREGARAWS